MYIKIVNDRNWGGHREGSGRKKTGKNIVNITLTLKKEEAVQLKKIAANENLSVSQFIRKVFNLQGLAQIEERKHIDLPENLTGNVRLSDINIK